MPQIIEIPPSLMVPEHRHSFKPVEPAWEHVVASGEVNLKDGAQTDDAILTAAALQGHEDDETSWYEVHLKVGPWWRDVRVCVPQVTINGFANSNADEDDEQEWIIRNLKWATDGEDAPNPGEVRIRLEFEIGLRGEYSYLNWLGYSFMAAGRRLGAGGLTKPGPIKTGP